MTIRTIMGHAEEIITMDVYGDNRNLITGSVDGLDTFIAELMEMDEKTEKIIPEDIAGMIAGFCGMT